MPQGRYNQEIRRRQQLVKRRLISELDPYECDPVKIKETFPKDTVRVNKSGETRLERHVIVQWDDLKEKVKNFCKSPQFQQPGDQWTSQPPIQRTLAAFRFRDRRMGNFYEYTDEAGIRQSQGPTGQIALDWVNHGFRSSAFVNDAVRIPTTFQRRARWNEDEGDVDLGRMYGGYDDYYLGAAETLAKPGIKIRFEYAFAAGVSNQTIAEYGAWIMKLVAGMEAMGFDMSIDAWIMLDDLMTHDFGTRSNVLLRIKNVGETSSMVEWSSLFSPIGYRILGFSAKALAADKIGRRVQNYFGMTLGGRNWDLKYDKDSGIVTISCAQRGGYQHGSSFPAEELTKKAIDAGLIPDPDDQR